MSRVLLCFLFLFSSVHIFSQNKSGVLGGMNIYNVDFDGLKTSSLTGYHIGYYTQFELDSKININLILLYSRKNYKEDFGFSMPRYRLNYLDTQLLLQYNFYRKFNFLCGLGGGYLFYIERIPKNPTIGDNRNSFDFFLSSGISYSLSERIDIYIKYNYGLIGSIKSRFFELGLSISLKK